MRRRLTIGIGVVLALLVLLVVNALVVDGETGSAHVTVPGGKILNLPSGDVQLVERGPVDAPPIVLIHCFSCAIDWWNGMLPMLERKHRVIAIDLLGHGGSEKPSSGYTPEHQAEAVSRALRTLRVHDAEVVGHSLGGSVAVALAERDPELVERVVIIDMPPDNSYGDLGFIAKLALQPVVGEALWQIKPDFAVRDGLEVAFAPGFDVPDAFVEDAKRLTYTAYEDSAAGDDDFLDEESLDRRMQKAGKPLMVLMGAEEQIVDDPQRALAQYKRAVPDAQTHLVAGAGHSPNVEKPRETARLVLEFAQPAEKQVGSSVRDVTERGRGPQQGSPGEDVG
ncbi:MAG TPA: alpha/beta fold hydrolase [Solirubrobacterales bacterium]|nr:alpha/beta fold hydrolase [Solirubrobacterales bacterium]